MLLLLGFLLRFLQVLIIARVVISYVPALQRNPIGLLIIALTEPVMAPLRRFTTIGGGSVGLDFAPFVLLIAISFIGEALGVF